jgi:hypothetical protein
VIDFRYHIVSLVAVFLALALGLFLGSTTLQSTVTHSLRQQANRVTQENHSLETERDQLKSEVAAQQSFATAVESYAVAGKLAGTSVAVVSAPGVNNDARGRLITTLTNAGATVTADVRLQGGYLDSSQDTTWGQLAAQVAGTRPLPRTNGAGQAATELAHVLVNRPAAHITSARRIETVLSTFSAGKMLTLSGPAPVRPAELAVLLVPLGSAPDTSAIAVAQYDDLIALARELRHSSSGVVVAGPTIDATANGGALAAIRADQAVSKIVSTVDSDDTAVGRVATVLALAAAPGGTTGSFGIAQSPPLPSQSPVP